MSVIAARYTAAKRAATEHLDGLDALRGYAAIGVLLFHARDLLQTPWLMPSGYLAVDIFFVMSGFVIANAYEAKLPTMGLVGFLKLRAIRLYPLFLLGIAVGLLRAVILIHRGLEPSGVVGALAANLLYLPAPPSTFSDGSISPLDGPGWSLIFEVWVNVLYAALLPKLSSRVLVIIAAGSALVMFAVAMGGTPASGGTKWSDLALGVPRILFSFSIGVLLFRHRRRLPDLNRLGGVVPLALVAAFMLPVLPWSDLAFVLVASPILVIAAMQGVAHPKLAAYGAATSYALYAVHFPLLELLGGAAKNLHLPTPQLTLALIAALLVIAPLLDRFYDRPIRRYLLRRPKPPRSSIDNA